jgi:hypothetical protein
MFFACQRIDTRFSSSKVWADYFSMNKSRKFGALLFITVIFLTSPLVTHAQDEEEDDEPHGMYLERPRLFYGGLIVGANFAQVDGDYFAGYHRVGLNAGGIVYAQLAKHVALSLEILYSQKGSKSDQEKAPVNPKIRIRSYGIKANYAEIPVMINYFDKRKSHFGIGVSYGRLVNSSESISADSSGIPLNLDFNNKYPFKKDAFDLVAGVELHLWKGFFLNTRFQYSLLPIRTELPPPDFARAKQYSNLWTVRLMYLLK